MIAFFGLNNVSNCLLFEKRKLDEIFILVSRGGFTYDDCLRLSISERRYFISKIAEKSNRENSESNREKSDLARKKHQIKGIKL